MFLSTLNLSISRSIDGGRAFSTLEIWSRVFQSRLFHPCDLVPRFPVPRFQRPHSDSVVDATVLCRENFCSHFAVTVYYIFVTDYHKYII